MSYDGMQDSEKPDLIDIGANLTHDSFDRDRDAVIARAAEAGVRRMIVTGASQEGSQQAAVIAANNPGVLFATAGVHPHHAADYNESTDALIRELSQLEHVVAVGECGLDYFRNFSPVEAQQIAFAAQLEIAAATAKPVFLHQRDAHDDFIAILREHGAGISGGVAHCFTAGPQEMYEYIEMGFYIGITGWICDERRGHSLREAVRELRLDRVLLETDAPYLVPRDLPGKMYGRRNEPEVLPHILKTLAEYMECDETELAAAATRNTEQLFGLS
jgi:TatD DNase family protein